MLRSAVIVILIWLGAGVACAQTPPASRFDGWASAIVAADWRTSRGDPIQAFDNARRDLTSGFLAAGFSRSDMYDATLRPDVTPVVSAADAVQGMRSATLRATRGCFLYFTSHGGPQGLVFGPDRILSPTSVVTLVRDWCSDRPTVVVISACYSGIFVDSLAAPNRMIMTAARRDRSSFGCSEDATYPYFDACVISTLPTASDFIALAHATRACVKAREEAEGLSPASEPQVSIGANMQLLLPTLRFNRPPG
ncbi:C13 family peptidase [Brevundimonas sp.]|uniref:C13 family peptidase n=1 Tax=Brevundimonas sp. TaxID=1871086 RepID=UPI00261F0F01|nr:C13 family peptidase [Brevundimonas sp.]